jgi:hypothetical protein
MSEQPPVETTASSADPPAESAPRFEPSLAAIAASLKAIRVWLIALTVVVALLVAAVVGVGVKAFDGDGGEIPYDSVGEILQPSDEQVAEARAEVEGAFGDRLESLEVRILEPDGDMGVYGPPAGLYVEYRLVGADVTVAGIVMDPFQSVSAAGLVPTRGSLRSRMSEEQFDALMAAVTDATISVVGGVRRYGDMPQGMPVPELADEITSGDRSYPVDELWTVLEGTAVEGDTLDEDTLGYMGQTAHVFHEDPETGAFVYLGTEPAMWW